MRPRDRYDSLIQFYAEEHRVDWRLLKAQMLAESDADPDAISPAGAIGLAQFMHGTWLEWWDGTAGIQGVPRWDRTNPEASIRSQAAYMRWLLNYFDGRLRCALAAYNWGVGRLRRLTAGGGELDESKLPSETRAYLARIEQLMVGVAMMPAYLRSSILGHPRRPSYRVSPRGEEV